MAQQEAERTASEPWVPVSNTFGMRLAMIEQHMRLSGAAVARLCGYSSSTWSNWRAGATPANIGAVAQHIAEVTGADRDWLLFGTSVTYGEHKLWYVHSPCNQLRFELGDKDVAGWELRAGVQAWTPTKHSSTGTPVTNAHAASPKTPCAATETHSGPSSEPSTMAA